MRYKNIIYPEAMDKLDSSGIAKRIRDADRNHDIPILGFTSQTDVAPMVYKMNNGGFFEYLPKNKEGFDFQKNIEDLYQSPEKHFWKINRFGKELKEEAELEDVLGMIGWWSSIILKPKEIFDYQNFGFKNLTDFTGSVSALMRNLSHRNFRDGYKWESQTEEGKIFSNEITGNIHCDLQIDRTDITPYETLDPIGNQVSYRPETRKDMNGIYSYHSTEPTLLTTLLRWNEQCNLEIESLKNKAQDTIEWAKSLGQRGGATAEHSFPDSNNFENVSYFHPSFPIALIDDENKSEKQTIHNLMSNSDSSYRIYIDSKNNLVFTYQPMDKDSPEKKVITRFMPEEADHLVKGLLYQSAMGLGRTSASKLISMIEYRFSSQYEKDLERFSI